MSFEHQTLSSDSKSKLHAHNQQITTSIVKMSCFLTSKHLLYHCTNAEAYICKGAIDNASRRGFSYLFHYVAVTEEFMAKLRKAQNTLLCQLAKKVNHLALQWLTEFHQLWTIFFPRVLHFWVMKFTSTTDIFIRQFTGYSFGNQQTQIRTQTICPL